MKNKWFWVWLSILVIPVFSLIVVQIDTSSGASIGGGGYDLGPFLYSWLLIIVTGVWSLCTFVTALIHRDRAAKIRALGLTAMGFITFVTVLLLYQKNLS
ncbi:hypothetical protein FLX27_15685 [Agrobacterium tumefaciens]|jgi:uncharacterized membrane protein YhaH (DUF805 family)|nr:hypothetical protein [Agrobacterium tumefaciens]TQN60690.1 hypothetical protein FLX27_15685 [Agrobacterium tumefaciens]CDN94980.1 hypothetical protein BN949_04152 [Agrobacterium tumefaciens]